MPRASRLKGLLALSTNFLYCMGGKGFSPQKKEERNQLPKGIMRSAVPLPCFIDVIKSQRVAGQQPRQGTKSCRMGRNSVRTYVRPSVRPPVHPPPLWLALKHLGSRVDRPTKGWTGRWMDVWMDGRMKFLHILQDFVALPLCRCPASL